MQFLTLIFPYVRFFFHQPYFDESSKDDKRIFWLKKLPQLGSEKCVSKFETTICTNSHTSKAISQWGKLFSKGVRISFFIQLYFHKIFLHLLLNDCNDAPYFLLDANSENMPTHCDCSYFRWEFHWMKMAYVRQWPVGRYKGTECRQCTMGPFFIPFHFWNSYCDCHLAFSIVEILYKNKIDMQKQKVNKVTC